MTVRELVARTTFTGPVARPVPSPRSVPAPDGRHGRSAGSVNVTDLIRRERPAAATPLETTAVLPDELFWLLRNADFNSGVVGQRPAPRPPVPQRPVPQRPAPRPPARPDFPGFQGRLSPQAAAIAAATTCQFDAISDAPEPPPPPARGGRTRGGLSRTVPRVTGVALALALAAGAWAATAASLGGNHGGVAEGPNPGTPPVPASNAARGVYQPVAPPTGQISPAAPVNTANAVSQPARPVSAPRPAQHPALRPQRPAPPPVRVAPPRYQPPTYQQPGGRGPGGHPQQPGYPQSGWQQQPGGHHHGGGGGGYHGGGGHHH